jgi:hypothetical protein
MGYNLFLDDSRTPLETFGYSKNFLYKTLEWVIVRNYREFVEYVNKHGPPNVVSFDHDLADQHYQVVGERHIPYDSFDEKTGYHCARWLISYCNDVGVPFPDYYVHSMNVVGRKNIISYVENYKKSRGE